MPGTSKSTNVPTARKTSKTNKRGTSSTSEVPRQSEYQKCSAWTVVETPLFTEEQTLLKQGHLPAGKKTEAIIDSIRKDPRRGIGHPKPLGKERKFRGQWSRRITGKHRLTYRIDDGKKEVVLLKCRGHYDDT